MVERKLKRRERDRVGRVGEWMKERNAKEERETNNVRKTKIQKR